MWIMKKRHDKQIYFKFSEYADLMNWKIQGYLEKIQLF